MDRRTFLTASIASLAVNPSFAMRQNTVSSVIVVGAGIIGAAIAYHLSRRGIRVTILEKQAPASGTTAKSFAYLNAGRKMPRPYFDLNLLGVLGWHRLQGEIPGRLQIQWGGSVEWGRTAEKATAVENLVRHEQSWGYPARLIDAAALKALVPSLVPGPVLAGSFCEPDGTTDPVDSTKALLTEAQLLGAKLEFPVSVTGLDIKGRQIGRVVTDQGSMRADVVVLACGNGTPEIASLAGQKVPLIESRGVLAHVDVSQRLLARVVIAPGSTIKQNPEGGIVTGESFAGTEATEAKREIGEELLGKAAQFLPDLSGFPLQNVTMGYRVMPADGFPIVGFSEVCSNLYIAAMHSGITLAPIVGQFAAIEIGDGSTVSLLDSFRPRRFV